MATRYTNLGAKDTTVHCFMPTYAPQLRILSSAPSREVPAFQASGTPGGGPGMRGMHHAPQTPPTSQDIKQAPTHLPPQSHPMPPQSGGQMMSYAMTGAGRNSIQQPQFYNTQRGPPGVQRITTHPRTPMIVSNNPPTFLHQPTVQQMYPGSLVSPAQPSMIVTQHMNQTFPFQAQPRHQGSFYPPQPYMIPQTHHYLSGSYQQMYYPSPMPQMSRSSGPAPNSQVTVQHPQSAGGMPVMAGTGSMVSQQPEVEVPKQANRRMPVIDPKDGRDVLYEYLMSNKTPPKSAESSARQTPQPNSEPKTDQGVAAEFATRVALAAKSDQSGSPNSPALQEQPSSRASNYSENESQASPDMQGVSPSKIDISVENVPSESQIVENNMTYDANQQVPMVRPGWPQVELIPRLIMSDDMMRAGAPPPPQLAREYQSMQTPWIPDTNALMIINSKEHSAPLESPVRPTPVVSALAHAPTVDIPPRHSSREQFPALVKGHQQPSPLKRKQKSEAPQEQAEVKSKEPQQQPPQPQQPASQPKSAAQLKPKQQTPTVESKKQSMPPSQDSDDHVQSIQTKNSESKTISMKVNEADSSESKVKSNDSLINKENNNLETRNLNEDVIQDNNNRNKSESVKSEVVLPVEGASLPRTEESSGKYRTRPVEEVQEAKDVFPAVVKAEPQVDSNTTEADLSETKWTSKANGEQLTAEKYVAQMDTSPHPVQIDTKGTAGVDVTLPESKSKPNGENVADDAKQNNKKQKPGNKRQGQSKMKLEKEAWNAEQPESLANEVTPAQSPAVPKAKSPPPPVAVDSGQEEPVQLQEDTVTDEEKEKEKEELIVVAKNEENNKQTASLKTSDTTNSPVIENVKKVVLKRNYKKDQWSPLNPEGKKKYDRDFILELMDDPQSRRKPPDLPNMDLLKDNTKQRPSDRNFVNAMYHDSSENVLYPVFGNKNSIQRSSQTLQKKGSQTSKPKGAKPHVIHMSLHQDVKLHETENAWKPSRNTTYNNLTEEEIKTEELYKRVRGVLNKLTPEKFSTLVEQLKVLPIDNHERLQGVIDLVFEKAVDEPSFSVAYAQMCNSIQHIQITTDDDQGKKVVTTFKKLLITRCQMEFEKDTSAEMKRKEEKLAEIEQEPDPEKKKLLQLMFEEEERRIRMKSVGNSRFIGELYKLKMLTCNIMHQCIVRLLNEGDEESLECLCKLLTTVGEGMEKKANECKDGKKNESSQDLSNYFKKLSDIAKNKGSKKVSSRVRFMIQDLIDLRNNKWIPRRDDSNPKTIDQIQKEAERETMEMNLVLNSSQERNKRQDSRNSLDYRKRGGGTDSSGWTTVPPRAKYFVDSDKLKLDHSEVDFGSAVRLGHQKQFAMFCKTDSKKMPQMGNNMYAVLNEKTSQPSSRNSSFKGSSLSDKDRVLSSYKSNYDDEGRSSRSGSQQGPDSSSSSRDSMSSKYEDRRFTNASNKGYTPHKPSPASNSSADKKSPEVQLKKAELILEEYSSCAELEESEYSSKKILEEIPASDFVVYLTRASMDLSGLAPKRAVGKILSHLLKKNIITKKDLMEGLSGVLESAADLALDFPLFWAYIAELMIDIFAEENLSFRDLVELLKPRQGSSEVTKLLTSFFASLVKEKSETWVQEGWMLAQVSLSDLIKEKDIDNFVKHNKLGFLLSEKNIDSIKMESIGSELKRMIASRTDFDAVLRWIEQNVSQERSSNPEFVKTLMTALLEVTVTAQGTQQNPTYKFDTDYFTNYSQLIIRYTDHKEELELPCLYAIQTYICKLLYPQGLVSSICESLWESGIIASESFMSWLENKDPKEKEGHAVCVKSLRTFMTMVSENMTDDDS
ncbi:UNVERIFIED_CONTAM: hypothetical protein PYX00_004693 [Menopon gallinae]|uniref:Eukaryotic translation initiation factor 4 gamma 1-like n=1 Tax=Menopon gallinae TaxID=328185 RepID=A0AAW2I623_9NEOP